jgi:hypothetical protein
MVEEKEQEIDKKIWKKFLRNHWKILILFIIVAIIAAIGAILVLFWFVGEAQLTGMIPATLGLWTMGHFVTCLVYLILWEILYIGIPILVIIGIIYYLWWKKIPDEEKKEYRQRHLFGKRSHRTESGEGISFLVFIAFIIKIYLDGNWNVAFATWTFDYLVYSCIIAFIWVLIIFGIPLLLGGTWWIHHEMKKNP